MVLAETSLTMLTPARLTQPWPSDLTIILLVCVYVCCFFAVNMKMLIMYTLNVLFLLLIRNILFVTTYLRDSLIYKQTHSLGWQVSLVIDPLSWNISSDFHLTTFFFFLVCFDSAVVFFIYIKNGLLAYSQTELQWPFSQPQGLTPPKWRSSACCLLEEGPKLLADFLWM